MSLFDLDQGSTLRAQERAAASARAMPAGVTPEVGGHYTISPDFVRGDRSWTDEILRVVAIEGHNVVVDFATGYWRGKPKMMRLDERHWYPAGSLLAALLGEQEGPSTDDVVEPEPELIAPAPVN